MSNRDEIIESFTRTLFVEAYASFVERAWEDNELSDDLPSASNGQDWMDQAPNNPEWVMGEALKSIARIEAHLGCTVEIMYLLATESCRAVPRKCRANRHNANEFGHYLAMQYVGHGVSWADDHAQAFYLPYGESLEVYDRTSAGLPEIVTD